MVPDDGSTIHEIYIHLKSVTIENISWWERWFALVIVRIEKKNSFAYWIEIRNISWQYL